MAEYKIVEFEQGRFRAYEKVAFFWVSFKAWSNWPKGKHAKTFISYEEAKIRIDQRINELKKEEDRREAEKKFRPRTHWLTGNGSKYHETVHGKVSDPFKESYSYQDPDDEYIPEVRK